MPQFSETQLAISESTAPAPKACRLVAFRWRATGQGLSLFFYDFKGRITETRRLLEGKRHTATHTEYSYTGKPTRTETKEYDIADGKILTVSQVQESEYSTKTDRLLSTALTVNGKKQTTQKLEYDRLGRICRVTRGGGAGAVSYSHNLHGWTTSIGSKDFSEELHYADGVGTPCHNGNVSGMVWQTPDCPRKRDYTFSYDTLDRLREAVYGEGDALPANKYSSMNFIDGADERREYT